jgi:hypothetical protein
MTRIKPIVLAIASSLISTTAIADLKPLDDAFLSDVTGQAFLQIDNYKVTQEYAWRSHDELNGQQVDTEFYRINIGAKMEAIASVDHLQLGKFDRYENGAPCPASGCDLTQLDRNGNPLLQERNDADIDIHDFALGDYHRLEDGTVEARPMKVENPFYEIAFENRPDGTREVIGARLGFERSSGFVSGDIKSLSGNLAVLIDGPEQVGGIINADVTAMAYLQYGEDPREYTAEELQEKKDAGQIEHDYIPNGNSGDYDPIRANHIGVLDGDEIEARALGILPINLSPENCSTSTGTDTCQPTGKFQTFEVGKASPDGYVDNFFISMQSRDLAWAKDPYGDLNPGALSSNVRTGFVPANTHSNFTQSYLGGFINIPSGGLTLTPHETVEGLHRHATRYTDAALGLFGQTIPDTGGSH